MNDTINISDVQVCPRCRKTVIMSRFGGGEPMPRDPSPAERREIWARLGNEATFAVVAQPWIPGMPLHNCIDPASQAMVPQPFDLDPGDAL